VFLLECVEAVKPAVRAAAINVLGYPDAVPPRPLGVFLCVRGVVRVGGGLWFFFFFCVFVFWGGVFFLGGGVLFERILCFW